MKPSEKINALSGERWRGFLSHPFVRGIADGSLPIEKFRYFMVQDHKYLMEYAKIFAIGIVRSETEEDMRIFSSLVTDAIDTENAVHQAYLRELGISRAMIDGTPMSLNNSSYTSYMIAEAEKGGLPEIAVSALACSWSYKVVGDGLAASFPDSLQHPFYGRWVRMYSGEEYAAANDGLVSLVDRFCAPLPAARLERLLKIVQICTDYECQFWDAAWTLGAEYTPVFPGH